MTGSDVAVLAGHNPYVGPRPIETGEHIFGREREISEIYFLLSAERIVLLHSPSGAGKSSLIQAGLIPRLRDRFDVWRPTRVNLPPPAGTSDGVNRYVLSAAMGFEQGIPESLRRPVENIVGQNLVEYVHARPRRPSAPENVLLIFDQFEEILTVDPLAIDAKHEFFDQLGKLLQNSHIWALVAMREDFLAPLDPYAQQVPTHLQNRFRIDLLTLEAAEDAILKPATDGGRKFTEAAVEKLVRDLATVKVQQPDGTFVEQTGLHVEPLQLQVACRSLWDRMPADALEILPQHVELFANVTEALSGYYATEVGRIAAGYVGLERAIREWVGEKLITPDGIRGQVLRAPRSSEGLANDVIAKLVDAHLVRAEQRAGAVWYELAHDRLIEPVRSNNRAWREAHLHKVQKQAALWESQGRPAGLLLSGDDLAEGQRWAEDNAAIITELEKAFLDDSLARRRAMERERRQARILRVLTVAAMVLVLVAAGFFLVARKETEQANLNLARLFQERAGAALQRTVQTGSPRDYLDAWIFTLAALNQAKSAPLPESTARLLLAEMRPGSNFKPRRLGNAGEPERLDVGALAYDVDSRQFVYSLRSPSEDKKFCPESGSVTTLYSWKGGSDPPNELSRLCTNGSVNQLNAVSTFGDYFVVGFRNEPLEVHLLSDPAATSRHEIREAIASMATGQTPKGDRLFAVASPEGNIRMFNASKREPTRIGSGNVCLNANASLTGTSNALGTAAQQCRLTSLAFSPEADTLAVGFAHGHIGIFRAPANGDRGQTPPALPVLKDIGAGEAEITSLSFWPGTALLIAGSSDGMLVIWDTKKNRQLVRAPLHDAAILTAVLNRDQTMLITASQDGVVRDTSLKETLFGLDRQWDFGSTIRSGSDPQQVQDLYKVSLDNLGYRLEGSEPRRSSGFEEAALRYFRLGFEPHFSFDDRNLIYRRGRYPHPLPEKYTYPIFSGDEITLIPDELDSAAAALLLKKDLPGEFAVEFEYSATASKKQRADGLVFMFYKDVRPYFTQPPPSGSAKGFVPGSGYGVHFDIYNNAIQLKDPTGRILASKKGVLVYTDGKWTKASIQVSPRQIVVRFGGEQVIDYSGELDTGSGASAGFGAASGKFTARQQIRNISLMSSGTPLPREFRFEKSNLHAIENAHQFSGYPSIGEDNLLLLPDQAPALAAAAFLERDYNGKDSNFTIEFEYLIKHDSDIFPAPTGDGLVFMFYKDREAYKKQIDLPHRRLKAFLPDSGYGVHFNPYDGGAIEVRGSGTDPELRRPALAAFHAFRSLPRVYGDWRKVRINVSPVEVVVTYEGSDVIKLVREFDAKFGGIGFGAASSGPMAEHSVRNVRVRVNPQ